MNAAAAIRAALADQRALEEADLRARLLVERSRARRERELLRECARLRALVRASETTNAQLRAQLERRARL